jgi:hypothetical protein
MFLKMPKREVRVRGKEEQAGAWNKSGKKPSKCCQKPPHRTLKQI